MGGHEGRIRPERKFYFTLMGACEMTRQTVARQILARRQQEKEGVERVPRQFFITLMGATEIKCPTLAEEFLDLRQMIGSGALSIEDWDRAMVDLGKTDVSVAAFTLMAGFSENELPSEEEEIEGLAVQRHLGNISDSAGNVLQFGIGRRDAERRATIRRAVLAEA